MACEKDWPRTERPAGCIPEPPGLSLWRTQWVRSVPCDSRRGDRTPCLIETIAEMTAGVRGAPCLAGCPMSRCFCETWIPDYWPVLPAPLLLDLNIQPADFLVQGRERNVEAFGGFGLIPVTAFQHVGDDAAFEVSDNFKQGSIRRRIVHAEGRTASQHGIGQQIDADLRSRRQHNSALDHVLKFAHIARP